MNRNDAERPIVVLGVWTAASEPCDADGFEIGTTYEEKQESARQEELEHLRREATAPDSNERTLARLNAKRARSDFERFSVGVCQDRRRRAPALQRSTTRGRRARSPRRTPRRTTAAPSRGDPHLDDPDDGESDPPPAEYRGARLVAIVRHGPVRYCRDWLVARRIAREVFR
jgi:hypothetical protein